MENNERNGITLSELWQAVKKRLWVVIAVTLVLAIAVYLAVALYLNPTSGVYSLQFNLHYPVREELKYPDGAPFYYQDMISIEMLERAKAADPQFKDIDVNRLLAEDKISISAEIWGEDRIYTGSYTLRAARSCFANREVATAFLKAVACMPIELVKLRAAETDFYLPEGVYASAYSFRDRIELLYEQRARMLGQYDAWIDLFGGSYLADGDSLKNYRTELEVIFSDSLREKMSKDLKVYGYVPAPQLKSKIAELEDERAVNELRIQYLGELLDSAEPSDSTESIFSHLSELVVRNVEIDYQLEMLTEENVAAFEEILNGEYARLKAAADTLQSVAAAIYSQESHVSFGSARAILEGERNALMLAVGAAIVGFVLSAAIVCVVGLSKSHDKQTAEE